MNCRSRELFAPLASWNLIASFTQVAKHRRRDNIPPLNRRMGKERRKKCPVYLRQCTSIRQVQRQIKSSMKLGNPLGTPHEAR